MEAEITATEFYSQPTLDNLRKLTPADFDGFLIHLFEFAGYQVTKSNDNASLILAQNGHVSSLVMFTYALRLNVGDGLINALIKACSASQNQAGLDITAIAITRMDFNDNAISAAAVDPKLIMLSGAQLLRYYTFIKQSRLEHANIPPLSPSFLSIVDQVSPMFTSKPEVLAVTNNRGGIGKSTTAANIVYGLAKLGLSVLAIDMDPQANFTELLGGKIQELTHAHIGHNFTGTAELSHIIQSTPYPFVKLIAGHPDMRKIAFSIERWPESHFNFAKLLRSKNIVHHPLAGDRGFEWIVIDTPPDMGFYTQAAITSANYLIAPTFPSHAGYNGIQVMFETASSIRGLTGNPSHSRFLGFVATRYSDERATAAMREELTFLARKVDQLFGKEALLRGDIPNFFPIYIPETPKIVTATREMIKANQQGLAYPLFSREGEGRREAGTAYRKLVEEVVKRAKVK